MNHKRTISTAVCLFAIGWTAAHAQNSISDGLVAYFPFNGNPNDATGNIQDAQTYGNALLTTDRFGHANSAYNFGSSVGLNGDACIWGSGMNLAGSSLTISFWIDGTFSQALDDYGGVGVGTIPPGAPNPGGTAGNSLHIYSSWERIRFSFFYDDCDAPPVTPVSQWAQLSFTFDSSTMNRSIFLNGNVIATQVATNGFSGNDLFKIAGRNGVSMDDVRFYNRALSANEVGQLFAIESVPEPSSVALLLAGLGVCAYRSTRKKA